MGKGRMDWKTNRALCWQQWLLLGDYCWAAVQNW